jgi:hypothetical protein
MREWNTYFWFWVPPHESRWVNMWCPLRRGVFWSAQWWDEGWYVSSSPWGPWLRPEYWGGLGCSCNNGYCCRLCAHGKQLGPGLCRKCGTNESCRRGNCGHPCCTQVSPGHVQQRLRKLFPPLHLRLRYSKERMLHRIAEYIVNEPCACLWEHELL